MQFTENLRLAFASLAANKMRSLLTMLGIIIGISSVILITTIGTSIQKTLSNTFNQIGASNFFDVYLYQDYDYEDMMSDDFSDEMPEEDMFTREMLDRLTETYGDHFTPMLQQDFGNATLRSVTNEEFSVMVTGELSPVQDTLHLRGRTITQRDNQEKIHAIYVSDLFVRQYFQDETVDPIGQTVDMTLSNGSTIDFIIVGVCETPELMDKLYAPGTSDMEKTSNVTVPLDTMLDILHQTQEPMMYLTIRWNTEYDPDMLQDELQEFFEAEYAEKPGYQVIVQNEQIYLGMINSVINVITIAISIIAAISLIVGGVGVMNIMLVSITERTKEIGIRKALGAQNSAIRMQFVVEAILICLIGGIIGIILGIAGGMILGFTAKSLVTTIYPDYAQMIAITVQPSVPAILVAVGFSILTGVFFGYYPANKAAKMDPIDALRYD